MGSRPEVKKIPWQFFDASDDFYRRTAGLSSEQRVEEASLDRIIFKPVPTRSLFATVAASAGHLIATSRIMGAPAS